MPGTPLSKDNSRHIGRRGRIYTRTATLLLYENTVVASWHAAGYSPLSLPPPHRFAVEITLHFPDSRRRDVGNYSKSICDALSGVVWEDDVQIDRLVLTRGEEDRQNPRADITISLL